MGHGRRVAVAFGSNLGDRRSLIAAAAAQVAALLSDFHLSSLIETAPVGAGLEDDPPFLNAAGVGTSAAPAGEILDALLAIERASGRTRPHPNAPRTLDLDLVLVGDQVIREPGVEVPHPRFRERRFVLEPLAEIAPELRDPVSGRSVGELLQALNEKPGAER